MVTLVLQQIAAILLLLFGASSLLVSRRTQSAPTNHQIAWRITGFTFTLMGVVAVVQDLFLDWAFFAGTNTPVYDAMSRWTPIGNDGRSFLSIGLTVVMYRLAASKDRSFQPSSKDLALWMSGFLLCGMLVGSLEGAHTFGEHAVWLTYSETLSVLLLFPCLWLGASRDSFDGTLWLALTIYAFRDAVIVSVMAGFAFLDTPGVWRVPPRAWQGILCSTNLILCIIAFYRLRLATLGRVVPALFDLEGYFGLAKPRPRIGR